MKEKSSQLFILISAFLLLTLFVAKNLTRPFDVAVTEIIQRFSTTSLDYALYFFTLLGSIEFSCFAVLVMCWYLYRKYQWSGAFLYLFFFIALSGVEFVWKYVVTYTGPGPELARDPAHWGVVHMSAPYSFPSGHTFRSVFLLGIWHQRLSRAGKYASGALAQKVLIVLLMLGVGYSRIYLGNHWLSDVAGGFLLAGIGLTLAGDLPRHELEPA